MNVDTPMKLPYQELLSRLDVALDQINSKTSAFQINRDLPETTEDQVKTPFESALNELTNKAEKLNNRL